MRRAERRSIRRFTIFFLIALSHASLAAHYQLLHNLKLHFNWTVFEYESLLPWERDVHIALLEKHVQEENERLRKQNGR